MKAVVLAAGKGVRLRPITEKIPKVMVKLKGKPLLERILNKLTNTGIEEIVLIVGYKREVIEKYFGDEFNGIPLKYFVQEPQLGTANAILLVENYIKGNFLVLNGDVLVESGLLKELAVVDEFDPYDAIIVGRKVSDPWRYGVLVLEGNDVGGIVEKPAPGEEPSNIINAGIYRFDEKIFPAIKSTQLSQRTEYEIVDSIKLLIEAKAKVGLMLYEGLCFDIGDKEDLRKAEEIVKD